MMHPTNRSKLREFRFKCKGADGQHPVACYKRKHLFPFQPLNGALPRTCCFTDVDAMADISGAGVMVEFKSTSGAETMGQRIALESFSKYLHPDVAAHLVSQGVDVRGAALNLALLVEASAETQEVRRFKRCFRGEWSELIDGDIDALRETVCKWAMYVEPLIREARRAL